MEGIILFSGRYGCTCQYAKWISEDTGLPIVDLHEEKPNLDAYDYFIIGSSIIIEKPSITRWLKQNWTSLKNKPVLFFTTSGTAPGHPNLNLWMNRSLGKEIMSHVTYIPLRGRLVINELPWLIKLILKIGAKREKDDEVRDRMTNGFDYIDKSSISPIVNWAKEHELVFV